MRISGFEAFDVRFPTSQHLDGSDAMNPDPDYSAAYVVLKTDSKDVSGYGMTFTIGRGNELCVAAIRALAPLIVGQSVASLMAEPWKLYRKIDGGQSTAMGRSEKGVIHLAAAAVVNAVWDLWARTQEKPVWKLVCDMSAEQLVASIDFRYLTDVLTPSQALEILRQHESTKSARVEHLQSEAIPATPLPQVGSVTRTKPCARSARI